MASPQFASLNGITTVCITERHTELHHCVPLGCITTSTHRKASPHDITEWHHHINTPQGITTPHH